MFKIYMDNCVYQWLYITSCSIIVRGSIGYEFTGIKDNLMINTFFIVVHDAKITELTTKIKV